MVKQSILVVVIAIAVHGIVAKPYNNFARTFSPTNPGDNAIQQGQFQVQSSYGQPSSTQDGVNSIPQVDAFQPNSYNPGVGYYYYAPQPLQQQFQRGVMQYPSYGQPMVNPYYQTSYQMPAVPAVPSVQAAQPSASNWRESRFNEIPSQPQPLMRSNISPIPYPYPSNNNNNNNVPSKDASPSPATMSEATIKN